MKFVFFEKFQKLTGMPLYLLIVTLAAVIVLAVILHKNRRKAASPPTKRKFSNLILAQGALCVSMSFVLSYFKLFSMPLGGSVTLLSMLPLTFFAVLYGPAYGLAAAFSYSLLQVVQGPYIVHWAQFILDYFVGFTCYGLAGFFRRRLPVGVAVAGLSRLAASTLSGVLFFADNAAPAGYSNAFVYSLVYNASTIGIDTVLCVVAACLPAFPRLLEQFRPQNAKAAKS